MKKTIISLLSIPVSIFAAAMAKYAGDLYLRAISAGVQDFPNTAFQVFQKSLTVTLSVLPAFLCGACVVWATYSVALLIDERREARIRKGIGK